MPVARHPQNRNSIVVVDLASDVRPLIEWNAGRLREALFGTDRDDRPGLKEVRLNHCPFVAPLTVVRDEDARRLELDLPEMQRRFATLRESPDLAAKIAAVYSREGTRDAADADAALYDGFIGDPDRARCADTLTQLLGGEPSPDIAFADQRLNELLFRLRARRDESSLSVPEQNRWRTWMRRKLVEGIGEALTLSKFRQALAELDAPSEIVEALYEHAQAVELRLVDDANVSG
jgi:exodeoxyribonuclease I